MLRHLSSRSSSDGQTMKPIKIPCRPGHYAHFGMSLSQLGTTSKGAIALCSTFYLNLSGTMWCAPEHCRTQILFFSAQSPLTTQPHGQLSRSYCRCEGILCARLSSLTLEIWCLMGLSVNSSAQEPLPCNRWDLPVGSLTVPTSQSHVD